VVFDFGGDLECSDGIGILARDSKADTDMVTTKVNWWLAMRCSERRRAVAIAIGAPCGRRR